METGETGTKPVVITEGQSHSKMFISMVVTGLVIGCLFVIGNLSMSFLGGGLPKSEPHNDKQVMSECADLIKSGDLITARKMLEEMESAKGLPPEMSNKLDEIYTLQAKQFIAKGATKEAIKLLQFIPEESPLYANAQQTIKSLNAPKHSTPVKKIQVKSHKPSHSMHHK